MPTAEAVDWRAKARETATRNGVNPDLFERLIETESNFDPTVKSNKGAIGLGQLMPDTAAELGVDPNDPEQNLEGSARYLKQQIDKYGTRQGVAAYNAGPGAVEQHGGIPPYPETQNYVRRIVRSRGTVSQLGQLVKKKWPGRYDKYTDESVGRAFQKNHPAYADFEDAPEAAAAAPATAAPPAAEQPGDRYRAAAARAFPNGQPPPIPAQPPPTTAPPQREVDPQAYFRAQPAEGGPGAATRAQVGRAAERAGEFVVGAAKGAGRGVAHGVLGLAGTLQAYPGIAAVEQAGEMAQRVAPQPTSGVVQLGPGDYPPRTVAEAEQLGRSNIPYELGNTLLGGIPEIISQGVRGTFGSKVRVTPGPNGTVTTSPVPTSAAERGEAAGFAAGQIAPFVGIERISHAAKARFEPKPEEIAAAKANVATPPEMKPVMMAPGRELTTELARVVAERQRPGAMPVQFTLPDGTVIADAHIFPNLVRVFPGNAEPVRATIFDNATGKMHSVRFGSLREFREAMTRTTPPGVLPGTAAAEGLPRSTPPTTKAELPAGTITPEHLAEGKARAGVEAEYRAGLERPGMSPEERIRTAPAAIAALEQQIADNPGDKRVGRWKRRLEKLRELPQPKKAVVAAEGKRAVGGEAATPPRKAPGPAEQPASAVAQPSGRAASTQRIPAREAAPAPAPKSEKARTIGTVTAKVKETIAKCPPGDCFRAARKWASASKDPTAQVVHGKLTVNGERFDHAWVEVGGDVVDPSVGARFDKAEFYAKMKAEPDARYEPHQAEALTVRTRNNGPWSRKEAAGRFIEHNAAPPALAPGSRPEGETTARAGSEPRPEPGSPPSTKPPTRPRKKGTPPEEPPIETTAPPPRSPREMPKIEAGPGRQKKIADWLRGLSDLDLIDKARGVGAIPKSGRVENWLNGWKTFPGDRDITVANTAKLILKEEAAERMRAKKKPEPLPQPPPEPKIETAGPPPPKPKGTAPKAPKRAAGEFERGERISSRTYRYKGDGFVLAKEKNPDPLSSQGVYRIRLESGDEYTVPASDLRRVAHPAATEADLKRIEAVEPGEPHPVVSDVSKEILKRTPLQPVETLKAKPSTFSSGVGSRSSANAQFITDGRVLYMTDAMDPKMRDQLYEASDNKGPDSVQPKIGGIIASATEKPQAHLEPRGWMQSGGTEIPNWAVFYDPKSGQITIANADYWKLSERAVAPDAYEQKAGGNGRDPIVLKRDGKIVGLLMPLRLDKVDMPAIREKLGLPPETVTHESRISGARARPRQTRLPSANPPPPSRGRGIKLPAKAPAIPTEAEARTLPETKVPTGKAKAFTKEGPLDKVKAVLHELVAATNPVRYAAKEVPRALDTLMRAKGGLKRALFRSERVQRAVRSFWEQQSKAKVLNFLTRLESGIQADPRLAAIAAAYRERADNMFRAISRYKQIPYWENYFPHMWKDQKKAEKFFASRRPMEGNKRFLKPRFFDDILAGLKAGLEPVSWNPEELMQMAEHNARKYVMVQEMLKDFQSLGAMKLVRLGEKPPENFRRVNQNWARLYLNPETEIKEAFDKKIMQGLTAVADDLGIKLERKVNIGGKNRLGYSESPAAPALAQALLGAKAHAGRPGRVVTRFATPESVLAHEIGHQIDEIYGLREEFIRKSTPAEKKELRALADLRVEDVKATPAGHVSYIRSGPEKMAVMLEALIHAPEEFKRVAPLTYEKFTKFLKSKSELAPLLDVKPSLLYDQATGTVHAGGVVLGGEYWAQEDLARLLDNHMSRDHITESTLGRGVMASRNTLNAIELGVSAFHLTGITLLSMMSRMGVGISEALHGRPLQGLGKIATAPLAPIEYARQGHRFFKGAPELAALEERIFTAGASLERKQYYKNEMFDHFIRNARQMVAEGATPYERLGHATKAAAQAPFAAIESSMRVLVPLINRMKVGAFRDLEASQLRIKAKDIAAGKDTVENVGRIAWRDIEDRFGQVNYDNEFWHNTLKASIMVLIRAPGWTLGTVRALGSAAFADFPRFAARSARRIYRAGALEKPGEKAPEFTARMAFGLSMVFTTMAAGGIYHYAHTGKLPETLEDYLHPQNGLRNRDGTPQRVNFPTFMKDVEGWLHNPVKELLGSIPGDKGEVSVGHGGKLAPEITDIIDLLENQTYRGPIHQPIHSVKDWGPATAQTIKYLFGKHQPFSIQQARKIAKEGGSPAQIGEQFMGITPYYPPKEHRDRYRYRELQQ